MNVKRTSSAKSRSRIAGDVLPEYKFDYRKARLKRYADSLCKNRRVVVLDPDVSNAFPTSESVNTVLRALAAMKKKMPKFKNEEAERRFWAKHDATEFIDWSKGKRALFPQLEALDQDDLPPLAGSGAGVAESPGPQTRRALSIAP